jgi:hypothetical protein
LGNISFLLGESLRDLSVQRELMDIYHNEVQSKVVYVSHFDANLELIKNFLNTFSAKILVVNRTFDGFGKSYEVGVLDLNNRKKWKLIETKKEGMVSISTDGIDLRVKTFNSGDLL